ncbi:hypothetical protein M6B38_320995 [Iris pallida]|uniref:Uncharacterized protein n=1 Tax=Iris pallida TaxID=29817 RepID=A0AAX6EM42_IRIPA|nr:hypothetical protein M6B38_181755 [Iris pallida]KAJ6838517.1 hypothetical protein M6B38_320995 [Iris pallida]
MNKCTLGSQLALGSSNLSLNKHPSPPNQTGQPNLKISPLK